MTDKVNVSALRLLVVPSSFLMSKAFGDSPETSDLVAIYFPRDCNFCSVARLIMKCHLGNPVSFIFLHFNRYFSVFVTVIDFIPN